MTIQTVLRAMCALSLVVLARPTYSIAQDSRDSATMQALVSEIRELRLSLERSNLLTLRFQAALQANQLHAERVKELSGQMMLVTTQLSAIKAQRNGTAAEITEAEKDLFNSDPKIRAEAEQRLPRLKVGLETISGQESDLRAREALLISDIQRETSQMEDWRRWLQQFEQSLQPAK
jgi:hypothetical protein